MHREDIAAVMAIEERVYPIGWTAGIFADCLRVGYCCWVWEGAEAEILGYGVLSVAAGEAHLLNLSVAPEAQGHGYGRAMLEHLETLARRHGAQEMFLEVRPSNPVAIGLYLSSGFREMGRRRGYYPTPGQEREDAVVMAKRMDETPGSV